MSNEQQPRGKTSVVLHLSSFIKSLFEQMPVESMHVENIIMEEEGIHQININRFVVEKCHPTEGQEQPLESVRSPPAPQTPSGAGATPTAGEASTSQEHPNVPHNQQEFVLKFCEKTTPTFGTSLSPQQLENLRRPIDARREGAVTRPRARKVQRMTGSGDGAQTRGADNLERRERSPLEIRTQTLAAPARHTTQGNYKLKFGNIYFGKSSQ